MGASFFDLITSREFYTECGEFSCSFIDYIEALTLLLAVLVSVGAVFQYFSTRKREAALRAIENANLEEERRWQHLLEAKKYVDEFRHSDKIQSALKMIDYEAATYRLDEDGTDVRITREDIENSLKMGSDGEPIRLSRTNYFVRDCFDEFCEKIAEAHIFLGEHDVGREFFGPSIGYYATKAVNIKGLEIYCGSFGFRLTWKVLTKLAAADKMNSAKTEVSVENNL